MATLDMLVLINDMNAKIFLLVVLACYMLFSFWRLKQFKNFESSTLSEKLLFLGLWIYSRVTLFFFPFMVVSFLHINTTLEEMVIFIAGFYSIIFVVTFAILIIKGFEKVLDLLGIDKGGMYK